MRRPAPSAAEHSRQAREPSTWAQGRQQVAQSGAYQNWSRLWNLMYPNLRPGTTPPLVYFGTTTLPDGTHTVSANRGGASQTPIPGAGYRGAPYTGGSFALPNPASQVADLRQNPHLIDILLHETAHTVQDPAIFGNSPLAEGGADANAEIYRNQAAGMFGVPNLAPYWGYAHDQAPFNAATNKGAWAPADQGTWFTNTFGRDYAQRGQFQGPPPAPVSVARALTKPSPTQPPGSTYLQMLRSSRLRPTLGALPQPRYS